MNNGSAWIFFQLKQKAMASVINLSYLWENNSLVDGVYGELSGLRISVVGCEKELRGQWKVGRLGYEENGYII